MSRDSNFCVVYLFMSNYETLVTYQTRLKGGEPFER